MKKYLAFSKSAILEQMAYPSRFFSSFFIHASIAGIMLIVWSVIYKSREIIDGYTFSNFATYMVLSLLIREVTSSGSVAFSFSRHVRKGSLSQWMLKPVNFNLYLLFRETSWRSVKLIVPAIAFIILLVTRSDFFSTPQLPGLFLLSLFLGMLLNFLVYILIGSVAFWTINVWGIISIFGRTADILSGSLFPLDFLPPKIGLFVSFLPFKYMHYAPISIYLGKIKLSGGIKIIIIQLGWIILLAALYKLVWGRGLKKYDAVGH